MSRPVAFTLAAAAALGVLTAYLARPPVSVVRAGGASGESADAFTTIPKVRVLLGAAARETCRLRIEGPYTVTAVGDFRVLAQGEQLDEVEVTVATTGLRIASQDFPAWQLEVKVHQGATLWVDGTRYRGDLRLLAQPDGRLSAINLVELEDYLASVLPGEMPADFGAAALEAQSIVARSFALFQMKTYGRRNNFDVYDSARSQVYRGLQFTDESGHELAVESDLSRQIVSRTRGIVLGYQGRLFCTYFSAICGGHTTAGSEVFGQAAPPLIGVPCAYCAKAPRSRWTATISRSVLQQRIDAAGLGAPLGELRAIAVEDPGSGQMPRVQLLGSQAEHTVSAMFFRTHVMELQLSSAQFQAELRGDEVYFSGRGWGHGVGLCQWGAKELAAQGKSCEEILAYYYPGSALVRVE